MGEKAGGGIAGGRVAVVPEVRGESVGEPGVDVGLDVPARTVGEFVAYGRQMTIHMQRGSH
ncbi:hypothetical protein [Streptomyces sp. enrichment culture]|uniref:hypothetical protein n=1 Tax=Streptomyces sp. enrichment culture TaxID=1795815 RepID=UPI003F55354B